MSFTPIAELMRSADIEPRAVSWFERLHRRFVAGDSGKLDWDGIAPPAAGDILRHQDIDTDASRQRGREALGKLAVIRLNGGLGTSMGLSRAKSLIEVREAKCFLDLAAEQLLAWRQRGGCAVPWLLMNSFRTRADSLAALERYDIDNSALPLDFMQGQAPRLAPDGQPAHIDEPTERWAPPGHGDVYLSLWISGLLDALIERGAAWAFVSNIDNLGAGIDLGILGHLVSTNVDFAMEVTPKTAADIKGGTLVRHAGKLALLERVQVPAEHLADFEDTRQLGVFNTNNLWFRLRAVRELLRTGTLDLPLIVNPKQIAGRPIVQLETAMGAAIGSVDRAIGIQVARARFAPVKTTSDLMAVRSDAFTLTADHCLRPNPQRRSSLGPPVVRLDRRHFQRLADFERRCPHPLSLLDCQQLVVQGDVHFGRDVRVQGEVTVRARGDRPGRVADGSELPAGEHLV